MKIEKSDHGGRRSLAGLESVTLRPKYFKGSSLIKLKAIQVFWITFFFGPINF